MNLLDYREWIENCRVRSSRSIAYWLYGKGSGRHACDVRRIRRCWQRGVRPSLYAWKPAWNGIARVTK